MSIMQRAVKKYREKGFFGLCWHLIMTRVLMRFSFVRMMRHKYIMNYLRKHYGYVIERCKSFNAPPPSPQNYLRGVIWMMWWQGADNAPDIVKMCRASLKRHCGGHKIIIITKDNYSDYITLPEHILSKVEAGYITLTHLSDIIRASLLAKYGGLWMDSTLLVADDLPEYTFSLEYCTIKCADEPDHSEHNISFRRWAGFYFAARDADNILFSFMRDMFFEYWKTHDKLIDYFLIDYLFATAFDELIGFRSAWENIPITNLDWLKLADLLNEEWNAEAYADLTRTTRIFKLTYKKKFDVLAESGKETVYGHLLSEYGSNTGC